MTAPNVGRHTDDDVLLRALTALSEEGAFSGPRKVRADATRVAHPPLGGSETPSIEQSPLAALMSTPSGTPAPPAPDGPGLTGADLERGKAERERDTAFKTSDQASSDFIRAGGHSLGGRSYAGSPAAIRALERQQSAQSDQDNADQNIVNLAAALKRIRAKRP